MFHYPIGLWACGKSGAVDISACFLGASDECSTSLGNAPCSFCIHSVSVNFDRNMSAALGASFLSFLLHWHIRHLADTISANLVLSWKAVLCRKRE